MPNPPSSLPSPAYQEHWVGAFFDVDNTLIPGLSIEVLFFRHLWKLGVIGFSQMRESLWFLTQRMPPVSLAPLRRNKLYLVGQQPGFIEPLGDEFVRNEICSKLSIRGEGILSRHQRSGHHVALISGSPEFLVKPLADVLNVPIVHAARLQATEGGYTGRIFAPLPYGEGKRQIIENLAATYHLDLKRSYAYGDSPGDYQALKTVGHPVVVNPIRGMTRRAREQGWTVTEWA
ncbi:MAG: HAD family hydrolase [Nitrospirales bacterium]